MGCASSSSKGQNKLKGKSSKHLVVRNVIVKSNDIEDMQKLVIVGDWGVGKTSLFYYEQDIPTTDHDEPVDMLNKRIHTQSGPLILKVVDTGGEERWETLANSFYRGAKAVIIMYEISRLQSFNNIKSWIDNVLDKCSSRTKIVIVGNKIDIEENREVDREDVEDICSRYNIPHHEISVKEDINVKELFVFIAEELMRE
eukprot:TRINITY_DN1915_c0_g1_i2.p1 TRINITY_DN1915_c0_g1~~TRINITY_DN1915_c0_g1_i2.p1  ORF type:complete len:199 (-),score=38.23 TRINITY_DN1915_c0_g1_i2:64-660(-)